MAAQFDGISANELAKAEELLASSGVPIAEIQRLSTEHTAVVAEQMQDKGYEENGHPLTVFIGENKVVAFLKQKLQPALQGYKISGFDMAQLQLLADEFAGIFRHYDEESVLPVSGASGDHRPADGDVGRRRCNQESGTHVE